MKPGPANMPRAAALGSAAGSAANPQPVSPALRSPVPPGLPAAPSAPRAAATTVDAWSALRQHTPARVALGRSGVSIPTAEQLGFGLAHAEARDAVRLALDAERLQAAFEAAGFATLRIESAAPDRGTYLLRPDLGRRLSERSLALLQESAAEGCDLLLVVGDGLSSLAVGRHALPLAEAIRAQAPPGWRLGPVAIALQARVALGDPAGAASKARFVAVLIGERPGLSSPDSLGIYLTREPRPGRSDAERNCISNVRPQGLPVDAAARKLWWLCLEADRLGATGVRLKDHSDAPRLAPEPLLESPPPLPPPLA